jgi:hypothetical protein
MCYNLQDKKYCIENKQYEKEEYDAALAEYKKSHTDLYARFLELIGGGEVIKRAAQWVGNENVVWTFVNNSFHSAFITDCDEVRDCRYCAINNNCQDCYDYDSWGENASLVYESEECGRNISRVWFCVGCWENIYDCRYSYYCIGCSNCFWCVGLRNKQYCIFNKQYTKEEYEKKVSEIVAKMMETWERWEFFSPATSAFGYNETVAQEYFPMTKDQAIARGYNWLDVNYDPVIPEGVHMIQIANLSPEENRAIRDSQNVLKEIFICQETKRPYRLVSLEVDFYKKNDLSLPVLHPDARHAKRMKLRPWRQLYIRKCDKTWEEMISVYPEEYVGKVYSEKAFEQEIFN